MRNISETDKEAARKSLYALSIIDEPEKRLKNPMLSFDLDGKVKAILESAALTGAREKPALAILRGTGGGKTRALEELRMALHMKEQVMCVAITFNSKWNIRNSDVEFHWSDTATCVSHSR
jgi:hypothetical protein